MANKPIRSIDDVPGLVSALAGKQDAGQSGRDILSWGSALWRPVGSPTVHLGNPVLAPSTFGTPQVKGPCPVEDDDGNLRMYWNYDPGNIKCSISSSGGLVFEQTVALPINGLGYFWNLTVLNDHLEQDQSKRWKIWAQRNGGTAFITSPNGLDTFTDHGNCSVPEDWSGNHHIASVIRDGSTYLGLVASYGDATTCIMRSKDGMAFANPTVALDVSDGLWEQGTGYPSFVWLVGNYHLAFTGWQAYVNLMRIGLAMGDGYGTEPFTRCPDNPVIDAPSSGWSSEGVVFPKLVYHKNRLFIYYQGANEDGIGAAYWEVS